MRSCDGSRVIGSSFMRHHCTGCVSFHEYRPPHTKNRHVCVCVCAACVHLANCHIPRRVQVITRKGEILCVSQFTLYGRLKKGTRPDFSKSMPPAQVRFFITAALRRKQRMGKTPPASYFEQSSGVQRKHILAGCTKGHRVVCSHTLNLGDEGLK